MFKNYMIIALRNFYVHESFSLLASAVAFSSSLSPDGKFLFVLRRRSDSIIMSPEDFKEGIYWVDIRIIEDFKPKNLK
jgi:hypothetical protein